MKKTWHQSWRLTKGKENPSQPYSYLSKNEEDKKNNIILDECNTVDEIVHVRIDRVLKKDKWMTFG